MKQIKENIWNKWKEGHYIVIPTNGYIKTNGCAVMGRGLALQAVKRFPKLPVRLGELLEDCGNNVFAFHDVRIFTFPVKHEWFNAAKLKLIRRSCIQLNTYVSQTCRSEIKDLPVYIPRVGCGNGRLKWKDVKPFLLKYLDEDLFAVCDRK